MIVCCAPSYLRGRRRPSSPRDLVDHACLVSAGARVRDEWSFQGPDGPEAVRVAGPLRTNDLEALRSAARAGIGIAALPSFGVARDLESGALTPLLDSFTLPPIKAWAIYAGRRHQSARLRAFLAWLATASR